MTRSRSAPPADVDAALRAAGLDDGATDPVELLAATGRTPELDAALIARLAHGDTPAHAAALRDLAAGAEARGAKAIAKDARRALYRLGQRGVVAPPGPVPEPALRRLGPAALEGFLSPIDGRGDRLVWVVRPLLDGGLAVMTAVVNEPAGLRDVALAELPRKRLREMRRDMETRHRLRMVEADGGYCDALVMEAFERARAAGAPGIGEYPTLRTRLTSTAPAPLVPSLYARATGGRVEPEAATRGASLLELPELATWLLERDVLGPYVDEIVAARTSPLLLSRPQQQERVETIVTRAVRELGGGPALARRLEETAFVLHATARADLAAVAAATAAALAASDRGGEGVPFSEALVRRSLAQWLEREEQRERTEAEGSVIVRPGARPSGPARRSPTR